MSAPASNRPLTEGEPNFPPLTPSDIATYSAEDVVEGYSDCEPDDPEPGPNRPPGYRWGWINRQRDRAGLDDGFDGLRHAYLAGRAALTPTPEPNDDH